MVSVRLKLLKSHWFVCRPYLVKLTVRLLAGVLVGLRFSSPGRFAEKDTEVGVVLPCGKHGRPFELVCDWAVCACEGSIDAGVRGQGAVRLRDRERGRGCSLLAMGASKERCVGETGELGFRCVGLTSPWWSGETGSGDSE